MNVQRISQKWIMYIFIAFILLLVLSFTSCREDEKQEPIPEVNTEEEAKGVDLFWANINQLCGKSFEGKAISAPPNDTTFAGKRLIMDVRFCEGDIVKIPFSVGDNRSRTWVLKKEGDKILLKHDHRHEDGSEDQITQYGGWTTNVGTETRQVFPADQETTDLISYAAGNIWWIDLENGVKFTYNLRRMGTDRYFSVEFDLTKEVESPPAPWGWDD